MVQPVRPHRQASIDGLFAELTSLCKTILFAGLVALLPKIVLAQPFTIPSASMEPTLQQGDYIVVSKFSYGWSRFSVPFGPPLGHGRLFGRAPRRGDVVVFKLPRNVREDYVKRVLGLPGDRLQVRSGVLFINNEPAPLRVTGEAPTTCPNGLPFRVDALRLQERLPGGRVHPIAACLAGMGGANDTAVYTVPADCFFMMGDNRDNSVDSRFPPYGGPNSRSAMAACPFDPHLAAALSDPENGVGYVPFDNLVGRADLILFSWSAGASLFKPWTWVTDVQPSRWFRQIT